MILGKITEANEASAKVQIDGEEHSTEKSYTCLSSYTPVLDDRVLIEQIGDSYAILGKLGLPSKAVDTLSVKRYSWGYGISDQTVQLEPGKAYFIIKTRWFLNTDNITKLKPDSASVAIAMTYGDATGYTNITSIVGSDIASARDYSVRFSNNSRYMDEAIIMDLTEGD